MLNKSEQIILVILVQNKCIVDLNRLVLKKRGFYFFYSET